MKKRYIILVVVLMLFPAAALAADGQLVSGPSGTMVNGWYSTRPSIRVDTLPGCPSGASGNIDMLIYNSEGQHHITLRSHLNGYPRIYRNDDTNGHETTGEVFSCPSVSTPYTGDDPVVFWQGDIKWDGTAPTISLLAPANNSNSSTGTVAVSGSVSDGTSGVWSVTVNGVSAQVNGGSFSANVPIGMGLNTLIAVAKDYAGNVAQAQVVVNGINTSVSNSEEGSGSQNNISRSAESTTKTNNEPNKNSNKNPIDKVPVPVKAAAGLGATGLGVASAMGYIPYKKVGLLIMKFFTK